MMKKRISELVTQIYGIASELESIYPDRHFTPDGHMVGSIGECLVAEAYRLRLMDASNKGWDASAPNGWQVEIKATGENRVSFRHNAQHVIVTKLFRDGSFEEIYNGPGKYVWAHFQNKKLPSNGQYSIFLNQLRQINVEPGEKLERVQT